MSHLTRIIRFVRHWHARIGVLAALFFLLLAVSGVALNHTDALRLAQRQVSAAWVMQWYGLKADMPTQGYRFPEGTLVVAGGRWVMDGQRLPSATADAVVGAVEVGGVRYIATARAIHLYQPDGLLLDKVEGAALPAPRLKRIGQAGEQFVVETDAGRFATTDALAWHALDAMPVAWAALQPLSPDEQRQAAAQLAPSLPLERVLLDLHSGRFFGHLGPWVMDLVALILSMLSLSGMWIYWRSFRKRHH